MGGQPDERRGAAAARRLQPARHASSARTAAIGPALYYPLVPHARGPRREKLPYRSYQFRAPFFLSVVSSYEQPLGGYTLGSYSVR